MNPRQGAANVRHYLASLPPDSRRHMRKLREIIRGAAPRAVEVVSYGIPAFKVDGRVLVYYAGWKKHVSLCPMTGAIRRAHARALKPYKTSKGTVQFPLDAPLPAALVRRLVKAKLAEVRARMRTVRRAGR